jgi:hypothetical protein
LETSNLGSEHRRFYLATRKDRAADAEQLANYLRALGWERTFRWGNSDETDAAATAVAELSGVRRAHVLVVLLPGGYGTHVEIGAALALQIPIVIHSPDRKTLETPYACVFHYHPGVVLLIEEVMNVKRIAEAMDTAVQPLRELDRL